VRLCTISTDVDRCRSLCLERLFLPVLAAGAVTVVVLGVVNVDDDDGEDGS